MYMNNPLPLPINSNPGMVMPPQVFTNLESQLQFAAKLITFILDFKETIDTKSLPVDKATSREKGQPLCMAQYTRMFTSYRVPALPRDYLLSTWADEPPHDEHIIVAYKNEFYEVPVKVDGRRLGHTELVKQMLTVVQSSTSASTSNNIGLLTSEKRDTWARFRDAIRKDPVNRKSLDRLETCAFLVCLDSPLPGTRFNYMRKPAADTSGYRVRDRDDTNMMQQMLHGGGSNYNTGNRWFDKTIQFVISSDGVCGLCYEHSPAEGIVVVQTIDNFIKHLNDGTLDSSANVSSAPSEGEVPGPSKLTWKLGPDIVAGIIEAGQNIDRIIEDLEFEVFRYNGYGKEFIKTCNVSPDVYLQLALQLTYYGLHRRMVATYESASTRRFQLGRVDCIRSASWEALEWVRAMVGETKATEEETAALFRQAADTQTDIMIKNILGEGIDVHLLGLREMAREMGMETPEIFEDPTYKVANYFALSTSQVPTQADTFMGYGAVVPEGYGASYNPHPHNIVFCLSAFHTCEESSTCRFSECLGASLDAMKGLLQKNNSAKM